MNTYRVYWLSGGYTDVYGNDVAQALTNAGYGGGIVQAIDYYEPIPLGEIVKERLS